MGDEDFSKYQTHAFRFTLRKIKQFHKTVSEFFGEYEKDYEQWRKKALREKIFGDTDGLSEKFFQESFGQISQRRTWANHMAMIHLYSTLEFHLILVIERFCRMFDAMLDVSLDARKGSGTTSRRIDSFKRMLKLKVDDILQQKINTLRILRNCIIHNNGLPNEPLLKTIEGKKLLPGKPIPVTDEMFEDWCDVVTSYFGQFTEKLWEKEQKLIGTEYRLGRSKSKET